MNNSKLRVSIYQSDSGDPENIRVPSREEMGPLAYDALVADMISAPTPIMQVLSRSSRINTIVILMPFANMQYNNLQYSLYGLKTATQVRILLGSTFLYIWQVSNVSKSLVVVMVGVSQPDIRIYILPNSYK